MSTDCDSLMHVGAGSSGLPRVSLHVAIVSIERVCRTFSMGRMRKISCSMLLVLNLLD